VATTAFPAHRDHTHPLSQQGHATRNQPKQF
jgi:hypothetical protein